ncbi:hypothetical protein P4O66_009971 [Electrophorus voltai]|uniref:Doublecortin domain-containing protein 2 n=1 Tax=Electrophorus voltai TaxID=2609070 RepID=A0AAD9DVX1_9TELE|nr:hypothetical protein P4O66_009971 [Electrophorus voltai]
MHGEKHSFLSQPVVKNIYVFRNGDPHYEARRLVINEKRVSNFETLLREVTGGVKAQFGAVRNIYTPKGGHRVESMEHLQNGEQYVAAGREKFKKLDYLQIGNRKKRMLQNNGMAGKVKGPSTTRSTGVVTPALHLLPRQVKPVAQSRITVAARFLKPIKEPCAIFVLANGDVLNPAVRFLVPNRLQGQLERILEMITEKMGLRVMGGVRSLHTFDGVPITDGKELEQGQFYVAVGRNKFKRLPYSDLLFTRPMGMRRVIRSKEASLPPIYGIRRQTGDVENHLSKSMVGCGEVKASPPAEGTKVGMSSLIREISQARLVTLRKKRSGLTVSLSAQDSDWKAQELVSGSDMQDSSCSCYLCYSNGFAEEIATVKEDPLNWPSRLPHLVLELRLTIRTALSIILRVRTALSVILRVRTALSVIFRVRTNLSIILRVRTALSVILRVRTALSVILRVRTALSVILRVRTALSVIFCVRTNLSIILRVRTALSVILRVRTALSVILRVRTALSVIFCVRTNLSIILRVRTALSVILRVRTALSVIFRVRTTLSIILRVRTALSVIFCVRTALSIILRVRTALSVILRVRTALSVIFCVRTALSIILRVRTAQSVILRVRTAQSVMFSVRTAQSVILRVRTAQSVILRVRTAQSVILRVRTTHIAISITMGLCCLSTTTMYDDQKAEEEEEEEEAKPPEVEPSADGQEQADEDEEAGPDEEATTHVTEEAEPAGQEAAEGPEEGGEGAEEEETEEAAEDNATNNTVIGVQSTDAGDQRQQKQIRSPGVQPSTRTLPAPVGLSSQRSRPCANKSPGGKHQGDLVHLGQT